MRRSVDPFLLLTAFATKQLAAASLVALRRRPIPPPPTTVRHPASRPPPQPDSWRQRCLLRRNAEPFLVPQQLDILSHNQLVNASAARFTVASTNSFCRDCQASCRAATFVADRLAMASTHRGTSVTWLLAVDWRPLPCIPPHITAVTRCATGFRLSLRGIPPCGCHLLSLLIIATAPATGRSWEPSRGVHWSPLFCPRLPLLPPLLPRRLSFDHLP